MKTFVLILAMLVAPLAAQNKQPQNPAPPQAPVQPASGQAPVQPVSGQAPAQPGSGQVAQQRQTIVFTAKELVDEYNIIVDRSETFYNNRMSDLLWTMGIIMTVGLGIVGILIPMLLERHRERNFEKELAKQSRKFEKALASDSGIHFIEHAKNLPYTDDNAIEKLCLVLYAIANFAKSEEISGIHGCFEDIRVLQMSRYSMGKDINEEHNRMLSRYNTAYTAIKENGFEERFKTELKSVAIKIEDWYSSLPENKKPDESAIGG